MKTLDRLNTNQNVKKDLKPLLRFECFTAALIVPE